jgi:hypothetical protein
MLTTDFLTKQEKQITHEAEKKKGQQTPLCYILPRVLFFARECPRDNPNHHAYLQDHVEN